jgi:hypothetical protein
MSGVILSLPVASHTKGLAWVASDHDVYVREHLGLDLVDVSEQRHVRPVPPQDLLTVGVILDEPDRLEASRAFQAEIKPADAAEA